MSPRITSVDDKTRLDTARYPSPAGICAAGLDLRLMGLLGRGPSASQGAAVLDAVLRGLSAGYAAFYALEGSGLRLLFKSVDPDFSPGGLPPNLMTRLDGADVRRVFHNGRPWIAVSRDEWFFLAAMGKEGSRAPAAFARLAGALAPFLLRCASAPEPVDPARAVLAGMSSLTQDTFNLMTGLSLCLAACVESSPASSKPPDDREEILRRALLSLENVCREYTAVGQVSNPHLGKLSSQSLLASYGNLLEKLGFAPERFDAGARLPLDDEQQRLAMRALMHVAVGMLEMRARRLRVKAGANGGVSRIALCFVSAADPREVKANCAMGRAARLINCRGGRAGVRSRATVTRIVFAFASSASRHY